jgi:hypothetical protein
LFKFAAFALSGLLGLGAIAQSNSVMAQQGYLSQVPQTNDMRKPISQIDPNKPLQIRVVNKSSVNIKALIKGVTTERMATPSNSVTFGRLHTSYLPLPISLIVYTAAENTNLMPEITVINNELIVTFTSKTDFAGITTSVYVNEKGEVLLF